MLLSHRRRQRGGPPLSRPRELGIALVEAAFVTPVFFMLVLGVVEIGLAMNDSLGLTHTVRAGTRVASASGNDVYADYGILKAIQRESTAIPRGYIKYIVIYKATSVGAAPDASCMLGNDVSTSTVKCNSYTPLDFNKPKSDFGTCTQAKALDWAYCPSTRRIILTSPGPDYIGVWIKMEHPWVTYMFGNKLTLTDQSVIQLEPREK